MADMELKAFPARWLVAPLRVAGQPAPGAAPATAPPPTAITFLWLIGVAD
jgi:hypothetical protein